MASIWAGYASFGCLRQSLHVPSTRMFRARQNLLSNIPFSPMLRRPFLASDAIRYYSKPTESQPTSLLTLRFWSSPSAWRRAGVNTLRCLIGCSLGDLSTMWYLQAIYPQLDVGFVMALSSKKSVHISG